MCTRISRFGGRYPTTVENDNGLRTAAVRVDMRNASHETVYENEVKSIESYSLTTFVLHQVANGAMIKIIITFRGGGNKK